MFGIPETNKIGTLADIPSSLPLLPVRDLVIFPFMIVPLKVTRQISARALEEAMAVQRLVMVTAQQVAADEAPTPEALYKTGTVCMIMRLKENSPNDCQLLLQGLVKAKISDIHEESGHYRAEITPFEDQDAQPHNTNEEALLRTVKETMNQLATRSSQIGEEVIMVVDALQDAGKLADLAAANLGLTVAQAQELLEIDSPWQRLSQVNYLLSQELAVVTVQEEIRLQTNATVQSKQRQYILEQQLEKIKAELGQDEGSDYSDLEERLAEILLPEEVRNIAETNLKNLKKCGTISPESGVIFSYINYLLEFPWFTSSSDNLDINHARQVLDADHAFLHSIKERILEYIAVRQLKGRRQGAILCFAGPPGVGKTSLGYSIGRALGRQVIRLALGGVNDEAEIRGHRRTYVGAMPGRIVQAIIQAGTNNPLLILDEIDKLVVGNNGNPAAALLEVLDPEQNRSFRDHYLGTTVDLSQVIFVATANQLETLPPALRDRLEVIELSGYTTNEKVAIAQKFIVPTALEECGLSGQKLNFSKKILDTIIIDYTREAGCRSLKRHINAICRQLALQLVESKTQTVPFLNLNIIRRILGPAKYHYETDNALSRVGIVNALAWTPVGGEILHVEAAAIPGRQALILTGQMGNIMKESAQIALSFVRSQAAVLNIEANFFANHEIHIHLPAAAMPKDGPSAGLAMAICLASLASGRPVKKALAVTGEISLRGNILAVGGLKEKLLAARRYGITEVFLPTENTAEISTLATTDGHLLKLTTFSDLLQAIQEALA